jgi:uncharacterized membrane protein
MALEQITFLPIFGIPLITYLGVITFTLFLITAVVGYMIVKGKTKLPFKWHVRLAILALVFASIHGTLGIATYI